MTAVPKRLEAGTKYRLAALRSEPKRAELVSRFCGKSAHAFKAHTRIDR
jgi:hypothetical protein